MTKILVNKKKIKIIQNATKIYPKLEDLVVTPTGIEQNFKSSQYGYDNVKVEAINLQDKAITLNENGVYNIKADEDYSGLNNVEVTLDAIEDLGVELNTYETEVITQETKIENIIETLKGKGLVQPKEVTVTPTKDFQTIEGVYNKVNVVGDEDLIPQNIKRGVDIFGVAGTGEMLDIEINNCDYLFYQGVRLDYINEILALCKNVTSTNYMFAYCYSELKELDLSNFDTSKCTSFRYMFEYCYSLKELDLSNFDTSNVTNMSHMLGQCNALTLLNVSNFDTSNVTDMSYMMQYFDYLTELDLSSFDCSKVTTNYNFLYRCNGLIDLKFVNNLGKGYTQKSNNNANYKIDLHFSTNLTHDSLMSVINGLYDLNLTYDVANGGTLYTQQLVLGANNLSKLTSEELSIAVNKGWNVS